MPTLLHFELVNKYLGIDFFNWANSQWQNFTIIQTFYSRAAELSHLLAYRTDIFVSQLFSCIIRTSWNVDFN